MVRWALDPYKSHPGMSTASDKASLFMLGLLGLPWDYETKHGNEEGDVFKGTTSFVPILSVTITLGRLGTTEFCPFLGVLDLIGRVPWVGQGKLNHSSFPVT
ncbi:hypothetical protein AMTR_s00027p00182940 [Amborella trichopoda]|uniref:Uncharacterized protein n=1 Tax=Amborella trichopoda TaxID=13333 RepID=W1PSE4_AMBTC|nr:hypothetical protein AMTR_s00027p00182940 [Amborella trichopoda]